MTLVRSVDDGGVRTLVLDRPGGQNAVGPDMQAALATALDRAGDDPRVHVVVLTGAGDMFSAGGDVQGLRDGLDARDPQREAEGLAFALRVIRHILAFPKPTIALLNGAAAGGGLALALACDMRIAAEGAKLAYAYAMIGLAGDFGINWLLARLIGPARARSVAFGGPLSAAEALRLGLVDRVVPADALAATGMGQARALAALSPPALAAIKRNLDAALLGFEEASALEQESFLVLRGSPEHRAAIDAMLERLKSR